MSERLTVRGLADALLALPPEVQEYEVWVEMDPSGPLTAAEIGRAWFDHDGRRVSI